MTRAQLEHVIRAAAVVSDDDHVIVFGSQSILGTHPDAPAPLLRSDEADICPRTHPERWDLVDGSIGELSPFHRTFGYYAQGVEMGVATLPAGWEKRLVPVHTEATRGATGWCLEPHDLVIAKLVAGREKDLEFVEVAASAGLLDRATLEARLAATELTASLAELVAARIRRFLGGPS